MTDGMRAVLDGLNDLQVGPRTPVNMAKNSENFDTAKLIELVREHDVLYDVRHADYKDATLTKNIWDSIGGILGVSGKEAKTKWRSKRDTYRKLKNIKSKSGQSATSRQTKWIWYQTLGFLDPFVDQNTTEGNLSQLEPVDTEQEEEQDEEGYEEDEEEVNTTSDAESSRSNHYPLTNVSNNMSETAASSSKPTVPCKIVGGNSGKGKKKQNRVDPVGQAILDLLDERKKQIEKNDESEEDRNFMVWCLSQLKKLPEPAKLQTKIEIMNLIYYKLFTPKPQ